MTEQKHAKIAMLTNVLTALSNTLSITYPDLLTQTIDMDPEESWKPGNQASMMMEMQKSIFSEKERNELRDMILNTSRLIFNEVSEFTDDVI